MANLLVHRLRVRRQIRRNRIFRDRNHPLDKYDDVDLYKKFRFRRNDVIELTDEISEVLQHPNRLGALPPILQVFLALRFFACGSFQDACGELIGVSQSTASRTISNVLEALLPQVRHWIRLPNREESARSKDRFFRKAGFPNVLGCIDGTHIRIQAPSGGPGRLLLENEYVNRKNYHSINVQVVCDADLKFINIVVKYPGSVHDARILRESALFDFFESGRQPVQLQGCFLGDSGYMLRDWLMTPLLNPVTEPQRRYNDAHKVTRCTVERSIGCAKRRWNCLNYLRVQPEKACQIITVCLMLHNRARVLNLQDPLAEEEEEQYEEEADDPQRAGAVPEGQAVREQARVARGRAARDELIFNYFGRA